MAVGVGGITTWGAVVAAGSGVGSDCTGACAGALVAVGKGANVGAGVGTGGIGVTEETPSVDTGGVANSAVSVACTRAASVS